MTFWCQTLLLLFNFTISKQKKTVITNNLFSMPLSKFAQNYQQILADGYSVQLHWVAEKPNELQQINLINRLDDKKYQDFTGLKNSIKSKKTTP